MLVKALDFLNLKWLALWRSLGLDSFWTDLKTIDRTIQNENSVDAS